MKPVVIAGNANPALAAAIAGRLGIAAGRRTIARFPDSELHVEIGQSVRGADVYLVQTTGPPVDLHLSELIFLADACRRAGAERLTAIIPYFGYARQDRRATGRDAIGGRIAANLLAAAGFDRVVAVDLHNPALEGFFSVPLEHLSAVALLANAVADGVTRDSLIVAPDLGAVKLATRYGDLLHLPMAIVHKTRLSAEAVRVREIVGEVRGRAPIIIDDMISTGATIEACVAALRAAQCAPDITVAATHLLMVGSARERLAAAGIKRLVASDSLAFAAGASPAVQVVSLAPMLAEAISRLNVGESLSDLVSHR
jgi:ribose-phosphate pyrophosphokinase